MPRGEREERRSLCHQVLLGSKGHEAGQSTYLSLAGKQASSALQVTMSSSEYTFWKDGDDDLDSDIDQACFHDGTWLHSRVRRHSCTEAESQEAFRNNQGHSMIG